MFTPPALADVPSVAEMVQRMDATVAGLPLVKKRLAVVLRRFMVAAASERPWQQQNVLILGPTGGGKTWLVKQLLATCPVIWTDTSATEYSDVGYQGRDLTAMYLGLTAAEWREEREGKRISAAEHRARAERWGVVLFDEFDKIRVREDNNPLQRQAGDRQVGKILQFELLKLVEGSHVQVRGSDRDEGFFLHTDNILHIAMGAFAGIEEQIRRHTGEEPRDDFHEQVEVEDLIAYGFIPELIGRFATLIPFPPLQTADLIRILDEQVLPHWRQRAADDDLELVVDQGGMHSIAAEARKHPLGARGLEPVLDAWTWRSWAEAEPGDRIILDASAAGLRHARLERRQAA